jgi:DNA polymerase-3 subunit epsilon
MTGDKNIEAALSLLEQNDAYRVLRRLPAAVSFHGNIGKGALLGIAVDVETTGLDVEIDEVIELGMIKFNFDRNGRIGHVVDTYKSFNEPSVPVPGFITELTGIHESDVKGHKIFAEDVSTFVENAALIVAHNAAFDRPFCESLFAGFGDLPWACSATEIDWRSEGISGTKLEYIAHSFGRFYDAHRAIDDCNALVNILSFTLPRSNMLVLGALLKAARRIDTRIFAEGAPFGLRVALKRLGYRWNDGQNGLPRAWWKDVSPEELNEERRKLVALSEPATVSPRLIQMTAKSRFRRQG